MANHAYAYDDDESDHEPVGPHRTLREVWEEARNEFHTGGRTTSPMVDSAPDYSLVAATMPPNLQSWAPRTGERNYRRSDSEGPTVQQTPTRRGAISNASPISAGTPQSWWLLSYDRSIWDRIDHWGPYELPGVPTGEPSSHQHNTLRADGSTPTHSGDPDDSPELSDSGLRPVDQRHDETSRDQNRSGSVSPTSVPTGIPSHDDLLRDEGLWRRTILGAPTGIPSHEDLMRDEDLWRRTILGASTGRPSHGDEPDWDGIFEGHHRGGVQ